MEWCFETGDGSELVRHEYGEMARFPRIAGFRRHSKPSAGGRPMHLAGVVTDDRQDSKSARYDGMARLLLANMVRQI